MKIETGFMITDGMQAWGVMYQDGHERVEGFVDPEQAEIFTKFEYAEQTLKNEWGGLKDKKQTISIVAVERITLVKLVSAL